MTGSDLKLWRNDNVKAVLTVAAASVGVVLPIDFLLAVDGYLMFLRPRELVPVWGWAWLFYAAFGVAIGAGGLLAARALAAVLRRDARALVLGVSLWLSLSMIAVALIRAVKLWIGIHNAGIDEWLGDHQNPVAVLVFLGCAFAARRDFAERRLLQRMTGFLRPAGSW